MSCINIVFPNQLFEKVDCFDGNEVVLVEEFLFFKQFNFHKKKLVFHRNSMKNYEDYLIKSGFNVEYIETSSKFSDIRHFISNLDNTISSQSEQIKQFNLDTEETEFLKMNYPPELIYETEKTNTNVCVTQGKEPMDAEKNYQRMIKEFPHLDKEDVKNKCYKNVGLYITWLKEHDRVRTIESVPYGWCAGATAMHLACEQGEKDIYMLGFDLSSYDEPLNNMYKGTNNYLPENAKGFNADNWVMQLVHTFQKFPDTQFYWVDDYSKENKLQIKNVTTISYKELDKVCQGRV